MSRTFVFNGWAADESMWSQCSFRRDRVFTYLEHLAGESLAAVAAEPDGVVLVGFSMGGTVALEAALKFPEKIRALVLVSATARMMEARDDAGAVVWKGMSLRRRAALKYGTVMMNRGNLSPLFADAALDRGLDYLQQTDLRARLDAIAGATRFPVVILQGDRDGIVRPPNADFLARIFPQAAVTIVPGGEHDLPRLAPETIDRAVAGMQKCAAKLPRGLIEVSNRCAKNCSYCGIRRDAANLPRYHLSEAEVLECAREAVRRGYPAIALQAGEIESEANTAFYERVLGALGELDAAAGRPLEVTLSLGEQSEAVYRRWRAAAGARTLRYLLRIETSNRELYAKLHPADHSFERRRECIRTLKRLGYVTGSGVMIGLPGQSAADLERDLDFFEAERLDMVGMGPYVEAPGTPLAAESARLKAAGDARWWSERDRFEKTLWMIRETRRRLPHVNIVAATALEALDPDGRAKGFASGANVYMPNLTPAAARVNYTLYHNKETL